MVVVVGAAVVVVGAVVAASVVAVSVDGDAGVVGDAGEAAAEVDVAWSESLLHAASRMRTGANDKDRASERSHDRALCQSTRDTAASRQSPSRLEVRPAIVASRSHDS